MTEAATQTRREELLRIAADLFATKGFKNTTVRDIADAITSKPAGTSSSRPT